MAFARPQIVDKNSVPSYKTKRSTTMSKPAPISRSGTTSTSTTSYKPYPPPSAPSGVDGAAGGAAASSGGTVGGADLERFKELNAEALEQALAAIEAEMGLTREQLLASEDAVGQEYKLLAAQAQRAREGALEDVQEGALERGIFRSGITAEAGADVETAFAEQLAQLDFNRTTQVEAIQSQLAALEQQEELRRLEAERQSEQALLDLEVMQLLADAGL